MRHASLWRPVCPLRGRCTSGQDCPAPHRMWYLPGQMCTSAERGTQTEKSDASNCAGAPRREQGPACPPSALQQMATARDTRAGLLQCVQRTLLRSRAQAAHPARARPSTRRRRRRAPTPRSAARPGATAPARARPAAGAAKSAGFGARGGVRCRRCGGRCSWPGGEAGWAGRALKSPCCQTATEPLCSDGASYSRSPLPSSTSSCAPVTVRLRWCDRM
jgi:hypothetical protein